MEKRVQLRLYPTNEIQNGRVISDKIVLSTIPHQVAILFSIYFEVGAKACQMGCANKFLVGSSFRSKLFPVCRGRSWFGLGLSIWRMLDRKFVGDFVMHFVACGVLQN